MLGVTVAQPLARAASRAIALEVTMFACSAAFPPPGAGGKQRLSLCSVGWMQPACRGAEGRCEVCCTVEGSGVLDVAIVQTLARTASRAIAHRIAAASAPHS